MDTFVSHLKADWGSRPRWMNPIFYFCLYMTFVYMPFDLFFKPLATDHEIWFGFALTGWWAKATEPVHWIIYAAGAYGFWKMKAWMWPWAAVYLAQIVIAMFVWNIVGDHGNGIAAGLVAASLFAVPMIALWRAKKSFGADSGDLTEP
ncbi:MAG: hypothetical protein ACI915_003193 [Gammaproteobacteria bacterium]|jgi:hypothetical protein